MFKLDTAAYLVYLSQAVTTSKESCYYFSSFLKLCYYIFSIIFQAGTIRK